MTVGPFEDALRDDDALGTWVSIGHPDAIEAAAHAGFDFAMIDAEHTPSSLETIAGLVRAAEATPKPMAVAVRIGWNDPVYIKRVLDIGLDGLMVPMIDDADDARQFVDATRYPPEGSRGVASGRASGHGTDFVEYVEEGHESLTRIAQIETEAGVENAAEIAAVDGIDALFVGPADLSASLGVFAQWDAPEIDEAVETVLEAGRNAGIPVGTLSVREDGIPDVVERGYDYLFAGKDTTTLIEGGRALHEVYDEARE